MSPDGGRFMAGFTLYDTSTLAVIAQQNTANAPFPISGAFNTLQNIGGSSFSPDGATVYSAFNVAPFVQPATRPQASTLLISDARHLGIKLGIKLPESIVAKMVTTVRREQCVGTLESGLLHLPLSTMYTYPILVPETTTVFLANDPCNRGIASASLKINNIGQGKLTFSVPDTGSALQPRRRPAWRRRRSASLWIRAAAGVARQPGTNLYSGGGATSRDTAQGKPTIARSHQHPDTIRVYMNNRQSDQRGWSIRCRPRPTDAKGCRTSCMTRSEIWSTSRMPGTTASKCLIDGARLLKPIDVGPIAASDGPRRRRPHLVRGKHRGRIDQHRGSECGHGSGRDPVPALSPECDGESDIHDNAGCRIVRTAVRQIERHAVGSD